MRKECSEKILLEKLKEALQRESTMDSETLDSVLQWWRTTCGITLFGSREAGLDNLEADEAVPVAAIAEDQKLPASLIKRSKEVEKQLGIRSLRLSLRRDGWYSGRVSFLVTGEAEVEPREKDNLIFVMAYNRDGELMGYGHAVLRCKYEGEVVTFDCYVHLPEDEYISAVEVRIAPRSSLL